MSIVFSCDVILCGWLCSKYQLTNKQKNSNLVLWFIIMSQSVMQKDWFAIFKVKVTERAHMIKIWQFLLYLLNCLCFCYKLGLTVHYLKLECFMLECFIEKLDCCVQGQGHGKISKLNVCPDDIFWIAEPFTTKLGLVVHHYEPDCLSKRLVCCLQGQGRS